MNEQKAVNNCEVFADLVVLGSHGRAIEKLWTPREGHWRGDLRNYRDRLAYYLAQI